MKRFLSIILAVALVIAMVPATFATEGETATVVYSPEYVFNYTVLTNAADKVSIANANNYVLDRTKSSGLWRYAGNRSNVSHAMRAAGYYTATNGDAKPNQLGNANFGTNGVALRLTVEADGIYVPTFSISKYSAGGYVRCIMMNCQKAMDKGWSADGETLTSSNIGSILASVETNDDVIELSKDGVGGVETYDSSATNMFKMNEDKEFDPIYLEKGDYFFIIAIDRQNSKKYVEIEGSGTLTSTLTTGLAYYCCARKFTLTRQPYVTITTSATEVEAGSELSVIGKAFNADDTDAGAVTYSVEPSSVASVADDGTVTALAVGDATITAKATISGVEYSDSVNITVKPVDKTHKFIFSSEMLSAETIASAEAAGVYKSTGRLETNRNYTDSTKVFTESGVEFIDEYSDFAKNSGSDEWAYSYLGGARIYLEKDYAAMYVSKVRYGNVGYATHQSTAQNLCTRYVYKINVKHPGIYDIDATMLNAEWGAEADVYIVKASDVDSSSLLKTDTAAVPQRERMTMEYIKSIPIDGRIGSVGETNTITNDYICTKALEKGEYYVIMHLNSDNPVVTNGSHILYLKDITLTESDGSIVSPETPVSVKETVSFGTNIEGEINAKSVNRGEVVDIIAPDTDKNGNAFKCWVKGTEENGVWVSSKASDKYKVMTNTYLTAVYDKSASVDGKVVEFYNENGAYITTIEAVDGKAVFPENPTLVGYEFAGWYTDEEKKLDEGDVLTAKITYAVAKYEPIQVVGVKANDNVKVNGTVSNQYNFGAPVVANDSKATYWLRNGKIAKFGTSYEYLIWDGANIMSSYDTTTAIRPIVILDTTSIDGAYMIEYDRGDKDIAEVGILFGSSTKMTVDSCDYKATSQWNREHGQFMAKPYGDKAKEMYARGYLIYNDGGRYKVIYTDAIEIK